MYSQISASAFRWPHESFGTNGRMTEMQAAIGRIQLKKLSQWVAIRQKNAAILTNCFLTIPAFRVTVPPADIQHAYYKYYVFLRLKELKPGWNRDRLIEALQSRGINCSAGSCSEIYKEQAFKKAGLSPVIERPVAKLLGETSLMFQVSPTLIEQDMQRMARLIKDVMQVAQIEKKRMYC